MRSNSNLLRLVAMSVGILLGLAANADQRGAQPGRTMAIDEQPGVVPDPREERLPAAFQRQAVSTGPMSRPGRSSSIPPIAISISCRETTGRCATGSASAARASSGRDCSRSRGKAEWPDWTPPPEMIAAPALSAALHGGRSGQSDGRARALSRRHDLPHPRHQSAANHRQRRLVGLLPARERRCRRLVFTSSGGHKGGRAATANALSFTCRPKSITCRAIA